MTYARSVDRLTVAVTPLSLFSLAWTRAAQAAHVMSPMISSNSVASCVAPARSLVTAMSVTSLGYG